MNGPPAPPEDQEPPRTPFGFKLLAGLAALYLGWRLVQGVTALIRWVT